MERHESTKIDIVETSRENRGKAPLLGAPGAAKSNGGLNRGIAIFDLIVRIAAAVAALAATIAMGTTEQTLPFFTQFFQFQASYDDLPTFTFFVIAMAIVCGYLILSIPFSVVCIIRPYATAPRLLLFVLDTVAGTLATAASSASAAIVYLAHEGNSDANWLAICQQFDDFCHRTSGSVVAGFATVVLLVFLVLLSVFARRS